MHSVSLFWNNRLLSHCELNSLLGYTAEEKKWLHPQQLLIKDEYVCASLKKIICHWDEASRWINWLHIVAGVSACLKWTGFFGLQDGLRWSCNDLVFKCTSSSSLLIMTLPQRKGAILRIKNVLHSFYRNFIGEFKLCSTRLRKARSVLKSYSA